jgi:hypothetical protein
MARQLLNNLAAPSSNRNEGVALKFKEAINGKAEPFLTTEGKALRYKKAPTISMGALLFCHDKLKHIGHQSYCPKRPRYSPATRNDFTISAAL